MSLLQKSPSDLLRMRSEQLIQRGDTIKKLVDATGPLLDKLDDLQPILLQRLKPAGILRPAFDIRFGQVVNDPDDDASFPPPAPGGQKNSGDALEVSKIAKAIRVWISAMLRLLVRSAGNR